MPHMPPPPYTPACHACPLPCMPPCHACPLPCTPPCHACHLPWMLPYHACPVGCEPLTHWPYLVLGGVHATHATPHHTHPPVMHAPCHACPLPCMPPAMHAPCHTSPPSPRRQNSWHTLLKILPYLNFVAGGKNVRSANFANFVQLRKN